MRTFTYNIAHYHRSSQREMAASGLLLQPGLQSPPGREKSARPNTRTPAQKPRRVSPPQRRKKLASNAIQGEFAPNSPNFGRALPGQNYRSRSGVRKIHQSADWWISLRAAKRRSSSPAPSARAGDPFGTETASSRFRPDLSLLPEIREAEVGGRLVFAALFERDDYQHGDGDEVGQHLVQLLDGEVRAGGEEEI